MSGTLKSEGTTTRLLEAAREVLVPHSQRYLDVIDAIQALHIAAIDSAVLDVKDVRTRAIQDIRAMCDRLRSFMAAAEVSGNTCLPADASAGSHHPAWLLSRFAPRPDTRV